MRQQHAWLVGLVVFALVVIPGFFRLEQLNSRLEEQVRTNQELIGCLSDYSIDLTRALRDRDAVNSVARAAAGDLWVSIRAFVKDPPSSQSARQRELLRAIDRYTAVLDRVSRTTRLSPYPDPRPCFERLRGHAAAFVLMAADGGYPGTWDDRCFGRRVTIRGTLEDDVIIGTDRRDVVFAYAGDDLIVTGSGKDRVCARPGEDTINTGPGFDRVNCGPGFDIALSAEKTQGCE